MKQTKHTALLHSQPFLISLTAPSAPVFAGMAASMSMYVRMSMTRHGQRPAHKSTQTAKQVTAWRREQHSIGLFCFVWLAALSMPVVAPGTTVGPFRRVVEAPYWVQHSMQQARIQQMGVKRRRAKSTSKSESMHDLHKSNNNCK